MSERSLAHIEKVIEVLPIAGADRIELVKVLGWQCIILKGQMKVGDKCLYIEIDSVTPDLPMFEFLRDRRFRVRTIKMRGQLSQGLAMPIDAALLKQLGMKESDLSEGLDVTDQMKISKYDPQLAAELKALAALYNRTGYSKKDKWKITLWFLHFAWFRWIYFKIFRPRRRLPWPGWVSHTNEPKFQDSPDRFLNPETIEKNEPYYVSEKLEGMSATYFIVPGPRSWSKPEYGVCSHNFRRHPGEGAWGIVGTRIEEKMKDAFKCDFPEGFALQGEIIGPGIQGNIYKRTDLEFYVFGAIKRDGTKLDFHKIEDFCRRYDFIMVPILDRGIQLREHTLDSLLAYADGKSILAGADTIREGVVIRSMNQEISFKVRSNEYLLNEKELPPEEETTNKEGEE
jgi:hypothetical protein